MEIRISTPTTLDKYPAKQHAQWAARLLLQKQQTSTVSSRHAGVIYLAGTPASYFEDSDQEAAFRQRRYFYYLCGVDEPDCHLTYDIDSDELILWLAPVTSTKIIYGGLGSTESEALAKYDIDAAHYADALANYIGKLPKNMCLFVLHPDQLPPGDLKSLKIDAEVLKDVIDCCRVIKDEHEIKLIECANEVSSRAHTAVLRRIATFTRESQVEAIFRGVCTSEGAQQAYSPIAGSGANAAVLHYAKNNRDFGDSQLMVLDAGAEWHNYSSDVTRSFPLNGHFTPEASDIYELVQEMQTAALTAVKPGAKLITAHFICHAILTKGLLRLGILHNGTEQELLQSLATISFYPHGLGHHLGLEVHDVTPADSGINIQAAEIIEELEQRFGPLGDAWKDHLLNSSSFYEPCTAKSRGLQPGMVITVEPGVYFNKYYLEHIALPKYGRYINEDVLKRYLPVGGIRIEDNFLITQDGWRNLTTAPKGDEALRIIRGEA